MRDSMSFHGCLASAGPLSDAIGTDGFSFAA